MTVQRPHIDRRDFLRRFGLLGLLPATVSLQGCEDLIRRFAESCPRDPDESGGVDWAPDVMHPVFYGFSDHSFDRVGARVWYPSYDGSPQDAPILKLCLIRWPVVLFLHGQPPQGCSPLSDYFKWWTSIPAVLARSGYVVVVPSHSTDLPTPDNPQPVQMAMDAIQWVRNSWEHAEWVDQRPEATSVVGHSFGAVLAAAVARQSPSISAHVGLSGPWFNPFTSTSPSVLREVHAPSLLMWCRGCVDSAFESLDGVWGDIPTPKVGVEFTGEHFDYQRKGGQCDHSDAVGHCTLFDFVAGDLIALFVSRYSPVPLSTSSIPPSLEPPTVTLTPEQRSYAGARLSGLMAVDDRDECSIDLRWEDGADVGTRHLGA